MLPEKFATQSAARWIDVLARLGDVVDVARRGVAQHVPRSRAAACRSRSGGSARRAARIFKQLVEVAAIDDDQLARLRCTPRARCASRRRAARSRRRNRRRSASSRNTFSPVLILTDISTAPAEHDAHPVARIAVLEQRLALGHARRGRRARRGARAPCRRAPRTAAPRRATSTVVRHRYFFLTTSPSTGSRRRADRSSAAATAGARSPSGAFVRSSTSTIVRLIRPDSSSGRSSASISGGAILRGIAVVPMPSIAVNRDVLVEVGDVRRDARDDLVVGRRLPLGEPAAADRCGGRACGRSPAARPRRARRRPRAPCRDRAIRSSTRSGNASCSAVFM